MAVGDIIEVKDKMQTGYRYDLVAPVGEGFAEAFQPYCSPQQMLEMGVFEGKYCTDCIGEFPEKWFRNAKLSETPDPSLNYFGIKSRQPLSVWIQKGWIYTGPTQGAGSNGIAGITWGGGCPKSIAFKSSVGERLHGTLVRFGPIASQETSFAVAANARPFSNGLIIR